MRKTYYKVVEKSIRGALLSAIGSRTNVLYQLNKTTTPHIKHSKLFVFDKLESARRFKCSQGGQSKIYECAVTNPYSAQHIGKSFGFDNRARYWDAVQSARKMHKRIDTYLADAECASWMNWPVGTIWCDSVTLTKEVQ